MGAVGAICDILIGGRQTSSIDESGIIGADRRRTEICGLGAIGICHRHFSGVFGDIVNDLFQIKNLLHRQEPSPALGSPRFLNLRFHRPAIKLANAGDDLKRKKMALSLGGILCLLLLVSVFFGWLKRQESARDRQVGQITEEIEYAINSANDLSRLQPGRARSLLIDTKTKLQQQILDIQDKKIKLRLEKLVTKVDESLVSAGMVVKVDPELYMDLGLIRESTVGTDMSGNNDQLFILDSNAGVVLTVSQTDRRGEVVGGSVGGADSIAGGNGHAYVLVGHKIVDILLDKKTVDTAVEDETEEWKTPSSLSVFGGSLYVLDPGGNDLSRYSATETGFGSRRRWFGPGVEPDLSAAVDMSIDGEIWILNDDGNVSRFVRGNPTSFKLNETDLVKSAISIAVTFEGNKIWLLQPAENRVVAFDKQSGEYAGQWVSDKIALSTRMVVNEESGKIFLLAGEKIYLINVSK